MFIHFAFGSDGKAGKLEDQATKAVNYILKMRRLKASYCTEFLPRLPKPGGQIIRVPDLVPFHDSEGNQGASTPIMRRGDFDNLPSDNEISYLPELVAMICFIKISLKKLPKSQHFHEYGKLGMVFDERFLYRHGMKEVQYYREDTLSRDSVINEWNSMKKTGTQREIELRNRILRFRKPAYYFPAFAKHPVLKITKGETIPVLEECSRYPRYENGYDFSAEQEHRIVLGTDGFLSFEEKDLRMIIVPNSAVSEIIENYLHTEWIHQPKVILFPEG